MKKYSNHNSIYPRVLLTIIIFLTINFSGYSQKKRQIDNSFFTISDSLFGKIYNYSFNDAEKIFNKINNTYESSFALSNLRVSYFWYLLVSGDKSADYYQKCQNELEIARERYVKKRAEISDPFLLGNTIYLYAILARLEILEKNYMKALKYLDKCSKYIKKSFAESDERFKFSTGLYHYYIAFSLRKYPYLLPIIALYPRGNKKLGINLLKQGSDSDQLLVRTESNYFLMKIYFESEKDLQLSKIWLNNLLSEFPDNMMFNYYHFKILLKEDKKSEAGLFLKTMRQKANSNSQLNLSQKNHFLLIARKELNNY